MCLTQYVFPYALKCVPCPPCIHPVGLKPALGQSGVSYYTYLGGTEWHIQVHENVRKSRHSPIPSGTSFSLELARTYIIFFCCCCFFFFKDISSFLSSTLEVQCNESVP